MSVTGVLLMYEKQMITWADEREYKIAPPAGAERQPIETLIAAVREGKGGSPSAVTLRSDPNAPAMFAYGREGMVYVNPYTAEVLGNGSPGMRNFFHVVTDWHRWLGAHGDKRSMGRAITGASNLAFLFLVVSGFYLWWPKKWTRQHLKPVTIFRGGLSGKARDFNWHNVIGFWCAIPLFFVVLGATVISYPWASNMVYRVAGTEPPRLPGPPGGRGPGGPGGGPGGPGGPGGRSEISVEKLNDGWAVAQRQVPGWRTITLRLPPSEKAPLTFTIDQGYGGQPQKRTTLTVNRETSDVVKAELFSSLDAGRRARTWLRFVHTGEYYGLIGQTIAGVASAGAVVLVWTGIALSLRRFRAWRSRKQVREEALVTR